MSVLNIIELQNVVTSASGLNPTSYLSNQVVNIQEMVQFDQKRINVNLISNFDTTPIQFISPVNFSNVSLSVNGSNIASSGGVTTAVSTIGTTSTLGLLEVGGNAAGLQFTQNDGSVFNIATTGNATFTGSVSAQNFITLSDNKWKTNVCEIANYMTILSSVRGVRFKWSNSGQYDIGVIAQDLISSLPEAVVETPDGLQVAYMKLVPVLVEAVKSLQARVQALESKGFNNESLDLQ